MKILYITEQDLNNNSGISQKVRSQSEIWRKANHDVTIVNFNSLHGDKDSEKRSILPPQITRFLSIWINGYLLFELTQKEKFDLFYSRSFLWSIYWNLIGQKTPIIFEINGDIDQELKARSYLTYLYHKFSNPMMMLACRGLVCVSHELSIKYSLFPIPKKVIANGYPIQEINPAPLYSEEIRLVFIGNYRGWYGVDKIISLAKEFPAWKFHLIGEIPQDHKYPNIIYHGQLSQDEAKKIIANCDIGISSLALHRIPLSEASPLKSREYLALGRPIIISYDDTDLTGKNLPFILNLPNTEKNIELNLIQIRDFVVNCKKNQNLKEDITNYFNKNLSYEVKESIRLSFLERIITRRENSVTSQLSNDKS
jgi:glycosyltransferase involved in cell wall biosynthesis